MFQWTMIERLDLVMWAMAVCGIVAIVAVCMGGWVVEATIETLDVVVLESHEREYRLVIPARTSHGIGFRRIHVESIEQDKRWLPEDTAQTLVRQIILPQDIYGEVEVIIRVIEGK